MWRDSPNWVGSRTYWFLDYIANNIIRFPLYFIVLNSTKMAISLDQNIKYIILKGMFILNKSGPPIIRFNSPYSIKRQIYLRMIFWGEFGRLMYSPRQYELIDGVCRRVDSFREHTGRPRVHPSDKLEYKIGCVSMRDQHWVVGYLHLVRSTMSFIQHLSKF